MGSLDFPIVDKPTIQTYRRAVRLRLCNTTTHDKWSDNRCSKIGRKQPQLLLDKLVFRWTKGGDSLPKEHISHQGF